MPELVLWPCSSLRARISEAQCGRNQQRARLASGKYNVRSAKRFTRLGDGIMLAGCKECPGVVALAGEEEK